MLDFGLGHHQHFLKNIGSCENFELVWLNDTKFIHSTTFSKLVILLRYMQKHWEQPWKYTRGWGMEWQSITGNPVHTLIHTKGSLFYGERNPCGPGKNVQTSTQTLTQAQIIPRTIEPSSNEALTLPLKCHLATKQ